ncbi:hypothetical protein HG535_0B01970 [Zygotorulaspora mrakii]|uniref:Rhodanese domain-containing protein n=1 Tax=Zygotorulaspora mrakii TaxID=42260 RepID=A0A7H9AZK8_ZYGMR|nr:uncharacterized protein HG535_0B01970 [Zygotorulaspora mrakii]QLG71159.1 hypothetical protein HG535_0B01970 [Zygotorulaspora mrakii]
MWKTIVDAWNGNNEEEHNYGTTKVFDFEGMKNLIKRKDPSIVLVDVREPAECEVVKIPGSINVPFRSHPQGFSLGDGEFLSTFGIPKPTKDKELVFYCASGRRAASAESVAEKSGYTHTALYPGSINDWVARGGDKAYF